MSTQASTVRFAPGFPALLTLLFIALKLTDNITWSWIWVLSPVWITFALAVVFTLIALAFGVIATAAARR